MPDASEHAALVLSAIIPSRRDLLDKALRHLTAAHFPEKIQANLFTLLERYAEVTGAVLSATALEDMLRTRDSGQVALYTETYAMYAEREVDESAFTWSVQELRDLSAERQTGEVITSAMEILRQGKELPTGEMLRGHREAREHLLEGFAAIDRDLQMQEAPEGDMRAERADILQDYADRKNATERGTTGGVNTGVVNLDQVIGGFQPGELILSVGYSSDGKTSLCVQLAWSAAMEQHKNVVFLTTETLRPQVRRKLIARHSRMPLFNIPEGFNSRDLKSGTLSPEDEARLPDVVSDFTRNPAYGRMYIAQVPRNSTMTTVEQTLYRLQRQFNIDLVVCDYLALLKSDRKRNSDREELSSIIKEAKQIATTFDDGRGVPFVSPWQVNREKRDAAEKLGYYTSSALAETSEATNSADVIVSLLAPTDNTNRFAELKMQVLKARDGETASGLLVDVDYATSHFRAKATLSGGFGGTGVSNGGGFDALLD